jgi:hypothetical protein
MATESSFTFPASRGACTAIPANEVLPVRLDAPFLLQEKRLLLDVVLVVAAELAEPAVLQLEDAGRDGVEHVAVVRDEQDGAAHRAHHPLEPLDRLGVEVVGRLVEDGQLRLRHEETREGNAAPLSAAHGADRLREVGDAELRQVLVNDVVALPAAEVLDRLRELRLLLEQRVVVGAAVDEMRDLGVPRRGGVPVDEPFGGHLARVGLGPELGLLG